MNKYTGFFKASVMTINPDKDWIEENIGDILEKEPKYTTKTREGNNVAIIDIYIKSPKEDIFKHSIWLENKEKKSRSNALQYINCLGQTQWVQSEDQLWDSFKHFEEVLSWGKNGKIMAKYEVGSIPHEKHIVGNKQYKVALEGEEELIHFIKMLTSPNLFNIDTNLFIDTDKLFKGDFSSLKNILRESKDFHFVAFSYLDNKMEQKVWKEFMKLEFYRDVMNNMQISSYHRKSYNDWLRNFEYSCSEYNYNLDKIQEFKDEFLKKQITQKGGDY